MSILLLIIRFPIKRSNTDNDYSKKYKLIKIDNDKNNYKIKKKENEIIDNNININNTINNENINIQKNIQKNIEEDISIELSPEQNEILDACVEGYVLL